MADSDPLDICACGCNREDHPEGGKCTFGWPGRCKCKSFRLACTAADMAEAYAEYSRLSEEGGL